MARIYNQMPGPITVCPNIVFIPAGSITIPPGPDSRSDSLDWDTANNMSVWDQNQKCICTFDFGFHAQIQGGNYAIIAPGSYLVYDSNNNVISTGNPC
jgi:hypothetical protein